MHPTPEPVLLLLGRDAGCPGLLGLVPQHLELRHCGCDADPRLVALLPIYTKRE
jgi:hypothetical protein